MPWLTSTVSDETAAATPARIPRLERICIRGVYFPAARRVRDPASWYPSFKAAIDGLTHKKRWVLPDGRPRCRYPHPLSGATGGDRFLRSVRVQGGSAPSGTPLSRARSGWPHGCRNARLAPIGPRCLLMDHTASLRRRQPDRDRRQPQTLARSMRRCTRPRLMWTLARRVLVLLACRRAERHSASIPSGRVRRSVQRLL